ncbi:MAG: HAMP domain-containing histidine kinase [Nonomuraea sp.]|nr:HAMP domain-containing histidine kinase [Nonomuraea sp.]
MKRSLQARLTLFYAAIIFAAGLVVVVVVDLPLLGIQSTTPAGGPPPSGVTWAGNGIGPQQLLTGSAVALAVLLPVSLAGGWLVAGRFLAPLRSIASTARAISAGSLDRRLGLGEPADEVSELGHILDDLFARLQSSFDAQRHFVANASHELRTPLAGLRTLLEVTLADPDADAAALRSACEEALALGEHQERLVRSLLTLATSERGVTRWEPFDLADLAADVLDTRRDAAARKDLELAVRLAPAPARGDPKLVESLIANLLDNAVKHNHPGGRIEITTSGAVLTVVNTGPAVPRDQVPRLLEPFQRVTRDGDGHGLGLAIVSAVARAHGATLSADARDGGGLAVTVLFP